MSRQAVDTMKGFPLAHLLAAFLFLIYRGFILGQFADNNQGFRTSQHILQNAIANL